MGTGKMINKTLRQCFVLFACYAIAFSPVIRAGSLSLPSSDLVAPKITQEKYVDTVEKNKSHKITVTVKDNVGVKQVVLYYRIVGTEAYQTQNMQKINATDDYQATIKSENIKPPGIEYYVQAMDHAGNTLLHGYSFSPLSVKTVDAASVAVAASANTTAAQKSSKEDDDDSIFTNKWFWIGLGVIVVGAAAGGGGGGGGGEPTATLSITTDEPVQ